MAGRAPAVRRELREEPPHFEKAGFRYAGETTSVLAGFPRVIMRLEF